MALISSSANENDNNYDIFFCNANVIKHIRGFKIPCFLNEKFCRYTKPIFSVYHLPLTVHYCFIWPFEDKAKD